MTLCHWCLILFDWCAFVKNIMKSWLNLKSIDLITLIVIISSWQSHKRLTKTHCNIFYFRFIHLLFLHDINMTLWNLLIKTTAADSRGIQSIQQQYESILSHLFTIKYSRRNRLWLNGEMKISRVGGRDFWTIF